MSKSPEPRVSVVVPNWNGKVHLAACLDSLLAQSLAAHIIVVENGSTDGSLEFLREHYPKVQLIVHEQNLGFTGGVNAGIRASMERGDHFVALLNNDAVADKNWLKELVHTLEHHPKAGMAAAKILNHDGSELDSTGEILTSWGLSYPRGRAEHNLSEYDARTQIFGASGGASLYRIAMFKHIGLFDDYFFAYYEDADLSFRAQLHGWQTVFAPKARVTHQIGASSSKIKDFTTYHALKNLPMLVWKNVPGSLLPSILPRFVVAYVSFMASAVQRGQFGTVLRALGKVLVYAPAKTRARWNIQHTRSVSAAHIWKLLEHDLPPNAYKLRTWRARYRKFIGKESA